MCKCITGYVRSEASTRGLSKVLGHQISVWFSPFSSVLAVR